MKYFLVACVLIEGMEEERHGGEGVGGERWR